MGNIIKYRDESIIFVLQTSIGSDAHELSRLSGQDELCADSAWIACEWGMFMLSKL